MKEEENNQLNSSQDNFGLPGDYFQRSAGSIFNKIEWQDEHKEFSLLLPYKAHGFSVPENYFDASERQLELMGFPNLNAVQKNNPFTVPLNYFERSEAVLLSEQLRDDADELRSFETLHSLSKQTHFKTAKDYFT